MYTLLHWVRLIIANFLMDEEIIRSSTQYLEPNSGGIQSRNEDILLQQLGQLAALKVTQASTNATVIPLHKKPGQNVFLSYKLHCICGKIHHIAQCCGLSPACN